MRQLDFFLKKDTLKNGTTVYRVFDAKDGGGYFAQPLKVLSTASESVLFQLFDGSEIAISKVEVCGFYSSQFDCKKECWKLNGTGDPFEQLCKRKGITSEQGRVEELEEQMEMWGASDYEGLLHCLA